jgi:hypothetical protein
MQTRSGVKVLHRCWVDQSSDAPCCAVLCHAAWHRLDLDLDRSQDKEMHLVLACAFCPCVCCVVMCFGDEESLSCCAVLCQDVFVRSKQWKEALCRWAAVLF